MGGHTAEVATEFMVMVVVVVVRVGVVVSPKFKMEIQFIKVAKPYAKTVKRTTFTDDAIGDDDTIGDGNDKSKFVKHLGEDTNT